MDGKWHRLVFASYGNVAETQGFVNKLAAVIDGGDVITLDRLDNGPGQCDCSFLDLSQLSVGGSQLEIQYFRSAVDNLAYYDLSQFGSTEEELDAGLRRIGALPPRPGTQPVGRLAGRTLEDDEKDAADGGHPNN